MLVLQSYVNVFCIKLCVYLLLAPSNMFVLPYLQYTLSNMFVLPYLHYTLIRMVY